MRARLTILIITLGCVVGAAHADDCLVYKLTPRITLDAPQWTKEVVHPLAPMDLLHGNVVATMVDNYEIIGDVTPIEDGYCVALKNVAATVGYENFLVQIDMRHRPDTCSYNAILAHEDEHIRAYLSVMDDLRADLKNSIYSAAASVMPIFVPMESDINDAIDTLHQKFVSHPDLILARQKIKAAEEIRNKSVDSHDDGTALRACFEN